MSDFREPQTALFKSRTLELRSSKLFREAALREVIREVAKRVCRQLPAFNDVINITVKNF